MRSSNNFSLHDRTLLHCIRRLLALLGPSERELSWAALWGKADIL
jgi:hypothetical protein